MASTISEKEKNLHHIPAGFEHSYLFFAQEIDIQSSLKVNLIIVYLFCAIQELREWTTLLIKVDFSNLAGRLKQNEMIGTALF